MKKLYYGLLMIGTLVGMQSISYGAAMPFDPKKVYRDELGTDHTIGYSKGDDRTEEGEIRCTKTISTGEIVCVHVFTNQKTDKRGYGPLDSDMFYTLESEYNKQEQQEQKKAAGEQVPGGYMAPNPQGGWMQKPDRKDNKEDK